MTTWTDVCALDELTVDRGAAALVDGDQVALFRLASGDVVGIGNHDPFSRANVLSRGIVGDLGGTVVVASPVYKQHFELHTGRCHEDPAVAVPTWSVRIVDGRVLVGPMAR